MCASEEKRIVTHLTFLSRLFCFFLKHEFSLLYTDFLRSIYSLNTPWIPLTEGGISIPFIGDKHHPLSLCLEVGTLKAQNRTLLTDTCNEHKQLIIGTFKAHQRFLNGSWLGHRQLIVCTFNCIKPQKWLSSKSVRPVSGRSWVRSPTASYQRRYKNGTRCFLA